MGQQSEEEGAQHTSLGGPCVQWDGAGCVNADPYCLRSSGQKVQQPVAQRGVEPQLGQFVSELLRDDCVECDAMAMASSVERLDLYANWKGSREDRLDVLHD